MIDVGKIPHDVAYVIGYANAHGRVAVTARAAPADAHRTIEQIERDGGRILEKRVVHGYEADALLRAVAATETTNPSEVF
jgi:hypothetical protein